MHAGVCVVCTFLPCPKVSLMGERGMYCGHFCSDRGGGGGNVVFFHSIYYVL